MYQFTKGQFSSTQSKYDELLVERSAMASEIRKLKERVKGLKVESDLERKTTEDFIGRLEITEKKYRSQRLDNEDLNRIKDERIKALLEENNNLTAALDRFAAKCMTGAIDSKDPLSKKIANVESICEEMKRDKRLVQKLEIAFRKMEEKFAYLKDEVANLREENGLYEKNLENLNKDYLILHGEKSQLEDGLSSEKNIQEIK